MQQMLTIGKLAKQANVTIETIRYYQRTGLLIEPDKPARGYRQYPLDAIARIRFIKRAQQAGFSLKEIAQLLALDSGQCDDVRRLTERKREQIDQQIEALTALRNALDERVTACTEERSTNHCSLIELFSKHTEAQS